MRAAGILICLVLAASAPDLASAAPVFTVPFGVLGTESGVAVYPSAMYTIGAGGRTLVRTDARGRRRPMRQFDRLIRFGDSEMDRGDLTSYSIAASARWLVVALHREDANQDVRTIMRVARRSGGHARTLVRCPRSSTGPLALRGSLLAYPSCDGASTIVSDLDRPSRRLELPTRGDEAAFAGARIVVFEPPTMFGGSGALGVYELADGRPVLSATDTYKQYSAASDGRVLLRRAGSCDSSPAVLLEAGTAEPIADTRDAYDALAEFSPRHRPARLNVQRNETIRPGLCRAGDHHRHAGAPTRTATPDARAAVSVEEPLPGSACAPGLRSSRARDRGIGTA